MHSIPTLYLLAAIVPDLCQKTCTPPQVCVSQISDLKLTRRTLPSSSPKTMTFLPPGKIDSNWFHPTCNSPLCSLLARSMSLSGSQHYYRTISARNLLLDELPTNPCSLQAPFVHTADCSPYLTVSDLNDQRLKFCSVKPLLLQHGNAGVGRLWSDSTLVPSEIGVNPFSLSAGMKVSRHVPPTSLRSTKVNLLKLSCVDKFKQTSSRQGRERSLSTSSFSKERIFPPTSLVVRGDHLQASKTGKIYQLPSCLLSCVKVRMGPVDTTIFISMRVEVLDGVVTSHSIVTNRLLFEEFEVRCKSFVDWIASGNFDIFCNILSNFYKFVSLCLYFIKACIWILVSRLAHHGLYDDATIVMA
ncbi:hypothetical protein Bca52824_020431 [Brassica carinata]|uniref:Uncharacterized protein n=1 Tax=Brassica carinata TaxID=52824 RepID=A0A8X7VT48_BRACI|nr:hypothetical protein Bca52824_020431 [Brassica carinata]